MKTVVKGLCLAVVVTILLATGSLAQEPIGRGLTPEREIMVQQKLDAKRKAGWPIDATEKSVEDFATQQELVDLPTNEITGPVRDADVLEQQKLPVRLSVERLTVVMPSADEVLELEAEYLAAIEQLAGPQAASKFREEMVRQLQVDTTAPEGAQGPTAGQPRAIEVPRVILGSNK